MSGAAHTGRVAGLYRYPVKGFTPEQLAEAELTEGGYFPCDRLFAVEDGPSGFDPAAPAHVSKMKFTVLARIAKMANAATAYDAASGTFRVSAAGRRDLSVCLTEQRGREAAARWLTDFLGEEARGPLKVVNAPGHRFTDHPKGYVSVINLASVKDLAQRLGQPVDPLRFRANVYVEGWPAWVENEAVGDPMVLGQARAEVFAPITRCAATQVDPRTGLRDLDIPKALFEHYGHVLCGVYISISEGGLARDGDAAVL